jgi:hypothetical protein
VTERGERRSTTVLAVVPVVTAVLAAAAPCSPLPPDRVAPSHWKAARHAIAPPGPSAVRLCRYRRLGDSPALERAVEVTRPRVLRRLVRRLDGLPDAVGTYACPNDDGRQVVAHFAYPDGHRLTVATGFSGCRLATNGRRAGVATDALLRQLRRLTAPWWYIRAR